MTAVAGSARGSGEFVDVIWNLSLVCPWDCAECCVDAVHVTQKRELVVLRSRSLAIVEEIPRDRRFSTCWDQAAALRQQRGQELDFGGKLRILDNLAGVSPKIDFSGGDPLVLSDTIELIREANTRFGRRAITVTATGPGLRQTNPAQLAPLIGELNFTYNGEPDEEDPNCPPTYARSNLAAARIVASMGVTTRAECPLTLQNIHEATIGKIYCDLTEAGIETLLLMRLFPVGRCRNREFQIPSKEQYLRAISTFRQLEAESAGKGPRVKVQCAFRRLTGDAHGLNPCDAFTESFGLMADGTVLGSPWAIDEEGRPLDETWVLGDLSRQTMLEILRSDRVSRLRSRADANHGECKIFSFLHGSSASAIDRIFEEADPLYA